MPTIKPRLNVTLEPHRYELLRRLSALQGVSMSSILAEFVDTIAPVLERLVVVLEQAQQAHDSVKVGLRRSAENAESAIMPMAAAAMQQLDIFLEQVQSSARDAAGTTDSERSGAAVEAAQLSSDPHSVITGVRSSSAPHPEKPGKPRRTRDSGKSARGVNT